MRVVRRKGERLPVHMSQKIAVVMHAVAASRQFQMLRTEDQNVVSADLFDRRTLPHIAEVLKSGHFQLSRKAPSLRGRFGCVDNYAALLLLRLRADDQIILPALLIKDDLRIALVLGVLRVRSEQRRKLHRRAAILQLDKAGIGPACPVLVAMVARVIEIDGVLGRQRGTGIRALVVVFRVRTDAHPHVLPRHKVLRGGVIPVFQSVHGAPRTPLIEQVPQPVVKHESVGIVQKARDGLDVILLAVVRPDDAFVQFADLLFVFQHAIPFFPGPRPHDRIPFSV